MKAQLITQIHKAEKTQTLQKPVRLFLDCSREIYVESGTVWVTIQDHNQDYILNSGSKMSLPKGLLILLQATKEPQSLFTVQCLDNQ